MHQEVLKFNNIFTLAGYHNKELPSEYTDNYADYLYKVGVYKAYAMEHHGVYPIDTRAIIAHAYPQYEGKDSDYSYVYKNSNFIFTLLIELQGLILLVYKNSINLDTIPVTIKNFLFNQNIIWEFSPNLGKVTTVFRSLNLVNDFKLQNRDYLLHTSLNNTHYYKIEDMIFVLYENRTYVTIFAL